jgi:hypothetical protein
MFGWSVDNRSRELRAPQSRVLEACMFGSTSRVAKIDSRGVELIMTCLVSQ